VESGLGVVWERKIGGGGGEGGREVVVGVGGVFGVLREIRRGDMWKEGVLLLLLL